MDINIYIFTNIFRIGPNGTPPYSAPEVTNVSYFHMTLNTTKADVWSWGAVLYRLTYSVPPTYDSPCYRPPRNQNASRDPHLADILRHTLVINPKDRPDTPWLAQHRYTRTP
jgi:serine/threonine protein kinase